MGVMAITLPSETIFSFELKRNFAFGIPISVSSGGLAMDADRLMWMVKALDGNQEKPKQFFLTSGMNGSALEHAVPEQLFSTPDNPAQGISAIKALQIANDQGTPIYTINQTNIANIVPQLQIDGDVKADIQNAVNAGKEVTVSKSNINFNGWTGCGYIIIDPNTGAGAYMIAGGMNGAILLLCSLLPGCLLAATMLFMAVLGSALFYLYLLFSIVLLLAALIASVLLMYGPFILQYLALFDLCGKEATNEYLKCLFDIIVELLIGHSVEKSLPKLLGKVFKWIEIYSAIYGYYGCNKDLALTCRYGYY